MKNDSDNAKKTSRRLFGKTLATALVAAPVISSLSSCNPSQPPTPGQPNAPTPNPSPDYKKTDDRILSNNPPVIIDGGSLSIETAAIFKSVDTGTGPRPWKHTQRGTHEYRAISRVRITDGDDGDSVFGTLRHIDVSGGVVEVGIWLEIVAGIDSSSGDVIYDTALPTEPQLLLTNNDGGHIQIDCTEPIDGLEPEPHFKGKRKFRRYRHNFINQIKFFRIGKVRVVTGGITYEAGHETGSNKADAGFRIILRFS